MIADFMSLWPKPGDEWSENQAGEIVGQFDSLQLQDDERDTEDEQSAGCVHGIEQCMVP